MLRMRGRDLSRMGIGFADESSQQLYGNTARLWSFQRGLIKTVEEQEGIISTTFESCCKKLSFAKSWITNIYNQVFKNYPIAFSDTL